MSDNLIPPVNAITEPWQREALISMKNGGSPYPQRITIEVTAKHLSVPRSAEVLVNPITEAIAAIPGLTKLPFYQVAVGVDSVTIWGSHRVAHDARYWITNDLWTLAARHKAGRRVKPGSFEITAVFRRGERGCQS
jgi:hypothetical protein